MKRLAVYGLMGLSFVLLPVHVEAQTTEMKVRLLEPISTETSHKDDKVTAQVVSPDQFKDDIVLGKVTESKSGSKYKGKSELAFYFNVLHHQGKDMPIQGTVKSVINSQGAPNVDDEGHVIKKKNNLGKVALATGIGAGIGAALGGGRGAAEGAAIGAAASLIAIKVAVKAPQISFAAGSVFILNVATKR